MTFVCKQTKKMTATCEEKILKWSYLFHWHMIGFFGEKSIRDRLDTMSVKNTYYDIIGSHEGTSFGYVRNFKISAV